jgi:hypothetical protein
MKKKIIIEIMKNLIILETVAEIDLLLLFGLVFTEHLRKWSTLDIFFLGLCFLLILPILIDTDSLILKMSVN